MTIGVIRTQASQSLGTGTTKTALSPASGLFMPSDAKALLGVKPVMADITSTTVQSISARLDVESADVRNMSPYEVLFAPIGAILGATANTLTGMEEYRINAPLTGGEALNIYGTALVANAVAPEAMAYVIVANEHVGMPPQLHAKLGTITASGTTADTDVAGTKYSFSGGRRVTELIGVFHPVTIAPGDALIGGVKITSSEFVDNIPQELPFYPWSYGLGATGSVLIPGVSRQPVSIPVKPGQVNIQDYMNCGILPATAGKFIDGVMYE